MKPPARSESSAERRRHYLKMRSVLHDRATGLPAVPLLFDRLRTVLDTRPEIGVIHLEIAGLDMVESLYGWQVFDRVVARAGRVLRGAVGVELPPDALLAVNRVAGDRFAVFVPGKENGAEPDAAYLQERGLELRRLLDRAFDRDELAGLSPGLTFRPGHSLLSLNPFFRFERCVYAAIREARGTHHRRERRRELSWGEELQAVIDRGAVETLFQPVVELASGAVLGHEAFARGPRDSLFEAPRAMFALSSRVGVAATLDRLCRNAALEAFVNVAERGKLFLNVLRTSFENAAWSAAELADRLRGCKIAPEDVVIEVSERDGVVNPGPFVDALARIKDDGFSLALDDLGTGRTAAASIERLRPDYLKLDGSLVRGIHENQVQQGVLSTLAELGDRIGASIIAESVETRAEAEALALGGARYGQGYLFAAPARPGRTDTSAEAGSADH